MSAKANSRARSTGFQSRDEAVSDAEMERFLAEHLDEIEAKLRKARESIARGEARPLEPLSTLLREARRHAKTAR
jgi:hypothetical protein